MLCIGSFRMNYPMHCKRHAVMGNAVKVYDFLTDLDREDVR